MKFLKILASIVIIIALICSVINVPMFNLKLLINLLNL